MDERTGQALVAEVEADLKRLGLSTLRARYIPERHVVRVSWPHPPGVGGEEGIEFPASREWAARVRELFGTYARARKRSPPGGKGA